MGWQARVFASALVCAAFLTAPSGYVQADAGDTPAEAVSIPNQRFQQTINLAAGQSQWMRVGYPGDDLSLAFTVHLSAEDRDVRDLINLYVDLRTRLDQPAGDLNWDYPGYGRIGMATRTSDTGDLRKFWVNSNGTSDVYFVRLSNGSAKAVNVGLTVERARKPAEWISPAESAQ